MKKRDNTDILVDRVPKSDPAYAIIRSIVRIVPATRWAFARIDLRGEWGHLLDSQGNGSSLSRLKREFLRQRAKSQRGPRIAATLGPLGAFESGITLLFADARQNFGILTLLRNAELGPFTSSEISMLTLALDSTSEQLSALRLDPLEESLDASSDRIEKAETPDGAFYVLDQELEIVLAWSAEDQRRIALTGLRTQLAHRLPAVLEETVRDLIAGWGTDPVTQTVGSSRPVPFLVVRTQPMSGPSGLFVGVRIDRFHPPHSLVGPAERYRISPREVQVLALLLDGAKIEEIALQLHITSSTVQDHIKNLLDKTGSRNRTELIARVLGWESAPDL